MTDAEIQAEYTILERSRKDPAQFGLLYKKYFDRIFNFIYRQTDDEDLTAGLCSQTFLNALNYIDKYEFRGVPVSAWFYKIASNEIKRHFKKANHTQVFSLEEIRIREIFDQGDGDWDEELIERLLNYLRDLPSEMLEVLQLRFFEDKDFKEIAFILDISESGAKMRTYRALDSLRENFNLKIKYE